MKEISMEEYLAMEKEWMAKQRVNSFSEKLYLSSNSIDTNESLYSTLDKRYDAIACELSPELELLLISESHIAAPVCSVVTFEEKIKVDDEVFNLLEIDDDLFICDTPLGVIFDEFRRFSGIRNDLFTCDQEVIKPSYMPCVEQSYNEGNIYEARICYDENEQIYAEAVILIDKKLVRFIDINMKKWLDLKFKDHKKVNKEVD
ncbi:hypothetical protein Tco_0891053, partial [Tanacetum coccineum]